MRLQQVFGLMFELIEIGTNGQSASRHDEPPDTPGIRWLGRRRFVARTLRALPTGGLSPSRGWEAPRAPEDTLVPAGVRCQ